MKKNNREFMFFTKLRGQIDFTKDFRYKNIREYLEFDDVSNYAKDFGCMISKRPLAVFTPRTVEILQQFLELANDYRIKVTCIGKGNSAYGQCQVPDGVIIDLKNLNIPLKFNSKECSSISIPAFKTWLEVIEFCKQQNKTIPITIDNLDLTVGGTLSVLVHLVDQAILREVVVIMRQALT